MADDEVNQKENLPESPPGDQSPPEVEGLGAQVGVAELEGLAAQEDEGLGESAVSEAGVAELENLVAQKNEELTRANTRLIELEQVEAELEERLTTISNALAEAVASYKAMVVQANPEVIEELISGDTIESINESLSKAKTLVSKVRQGVEAEISLAKVPAGAPERTSPDLSALSPREKIQYAVGGFSSRNR